MAEQDTEKPEVFVVEVVSHCDETDVNAGLCQSVKDGKVKLDGDAAFDEAKPNNVDPKEVEDELNAKLGLLIKFNDTEKPNSDQVKALLHHLPTLHEFITVKAGHVELLNDERRTEYTKREDEFKNGLTNPKKSKTGKFRSQHLLVLGNMDMRVKKAESDITLVRHLSQEIKRLVERMRGSTPEEELITVRELNSICDTAVPLIMKFSVHYRIPAQKIMAFMVESTSHNQCVCIGRFLVQGGVGMKWTADRYDELFDKLEEMNARRRGAGKCTARHLLTVGDGAFASLLNAKQSAQPSPWPPKQLSSSSYSPSMWTG